MKILLVNDDRWHPGHVSVEGVKPLQKLGWEFSVVSDGAAFPADGLGEYAAVMLVKSDNRTAEDHAKWVTSEVMQALRGYVRAGGGLVAVHSGTAGYGGNEDMHALLGGLFATHPPQLPISFAPVTGHAITSGVNSFTVTDEHYFMDMADGSADVFLTGESRHGKLPAGWAREEGLGRVCVLTPGHNLDVWMHPDFQRLLANALGWCAGRQQAGGHGRKNIGTALVTGADRGLGLGIVKELLGRGLRVFAGQYMPGWPELDELARKHPGALTVVPLDVSREESVRAAAEIVAASAGALDIVINNAAILSNELERTIRESPDFGGMLAACDVNAVGPMRVTEAFLKLLDRGEGKRLCFVSSEAGCLTKSYRAGWFGYCMSKSALNMGVSILFNGLRKDGYTFRLYHPGWVRSFMHGVKNERADLEPDEAAIPAVDYFLSPDGAYDENKLVLRDYVGIEWPW